MTDQIPQKPKNGTNGELSLQVRGRIDDFQQSFAFAHVEVLAELEKKRGGKFCARDGGAERQFVDDVPVALLSCRVEFPFHHRVDIIVAAEDFAILRVAVGIQLDDNFSKAAPHGVGVREACFKRRPTPSSKQRVARKNG